MQITFIKSTKSYKMMNKNYNFVDLLERRIELMIFLFLFWSVIEFWPVQMKDA